jgi:hypothetical protein
MRLVVSSRLNKGDSIAGTERLMILEFNPDVRNQRERSQGSGG